MRRIISMLAVAALMAAMWTVSAMPAFADAGGTGPTGCGVGGGSNGVGVANFARNVGGLGKNIEDNPRNEIKARHAAVKSSCKY